MADIEGRTRNQGPTCRSPPTPSPTTRAPSRTSVGRRRAPCTRGVRPRCAGPSRSGATKSSCCGRRARAGPDQDVLLRALTRSADYEKNPLGAAHRSRPRRVARLPARQYASLDRRTGCPRFRVDTCSASSGSGWWPRRAATVRCRVRRTRRHRRRPQWRAVPSTSDPPRSPPWPSGHCPARSWVATGRSGNRTPYGYATCRAPSTSSTCSPVYPEGTGAVALDPAGDARGAERNLVADIAYALRLARPQRPPVRRRRGPRDRVRLPYHLRPLRVQRAHRRRPARRDRRPRPQHVRGRRDAEPRGVLLGSAVS